MICIKYSFIKQHINSYISLKVNLAYSLLKIRLTAGPTALSHERTEFSLNMKKQIIMYFHIEWCIIYNLPFFHQGS